MTRWLLLVTMVLAGCPEPEDEPVGDLVAYELPPRAPVEQAGFPTFEGDDKPIVFAVPGLNFRVDSARKNPITAVGRCATWVMGCFAPGVRELDDCVRSVPGCTSEEPWNEDAACCPETCKRTYAELRRSGAEPYPAFDQTLSQGGACMPGLRALVEGGS